MDRELCSAAGNILSETHRVAVPETKPLPKPAAISTVHAHWMPLDLPAQLDARYAQRDVVLVAGHERQLLLMDSQ